METNNKIELMKQAFELKTEKKFKEAIEKLKEVLTFENKTIDTIEIYNQLSDLYLEFNEYDKSIDYLQKIIALDKFHKDANQKLYDIYIEIKKYNNALNIAMKMCEYSQDTQSYKNYIKILIILDKKQDAIEIFNNLDESIKLNNDILYLISTIDKDKKIPLLEKILDKDITHTNANMDLATIEFNNRNYDKVIPYCLNITEDHPLAYYYLAKIEASKQNYFHAIELYTKAIELDDTKQVFYCDLAKTYIDIYWLDEALLAIKKAINLSIAKENNKDLDENLFLAGWIFIKQNKYSKALMNLNSINKNSVFYSKAQILLQIINLKKSKASNAIIKLEELYNKEQDNLIYLDTLAIAYKELKFYSKAIDAYKKALSINPKSIYYSLELIDLLIDNKQYDEALKLIDEFKSNHENCPSIYNSLGRIYYRLKEYNKALDALDKYLKLDINNSETYYFKGLILNDIEEFEKAKNSIFTAIKLKPTIAKYYNQMARSYVGLKDYKSGILYIEEAIDIDQNEINYKKQAYEIAKLLDDKELIKNYKKLLDRSEKILKLSR